MPTCVYTSTHLHAYIHIHTHYIRVWYDMHQHGYFFRSSGPVWCKLYTVNCCWKSNGIKQVVEGWHYCRAAFYFLGMYKSKVCWRWSLCNLLKLFSSRLLYSEAFVSYYHSAGCHTYIPAIGVRVYIYICPMRFWSHTCVFPPHPSCLSVRRAVPR